MRVYEWSSSSQSLELAGRRGVDHLVNNAGVHAITLFEDTEDITNLICHVGAETIEQGDYSKFKGNVPYCYKKDPVLVDLLPGVPYNQQFSNCCKGGVLASWGEDPSESVSSFQIGVGLAGTSNKTLKLPKNFTLLGPGPGYTCGPAKIVPSTVFLSPDHKRKSQAMSKFPFSASNFPRLLVIPSLQQQEIVFA
ncbi:hypothetical protein FXO37_24257 [Capsicum annuum]|nr:hypothetical protein FXO37_24257 [Capsicum annuum]